MRKRVADLLVGAPQAASVKNRYGIVRDTLNRIAHANHRCERGAPRHMRCRKSEGGAAGDRRWRPLSNHRADQAPLHDQVNIARSSR
jgi:hypothetical protein